MRAWCVENDIGKGKFYYWLNKLRQATIDQFPEVLNKTSFVPIEAPSVVSNTSNGIAHSLITIRKNDTGNQVIKLQLRIAELELENKNLHETVTFLTRKLFGRSSETSKSLYIDVQMSLFDEAEVEADPTATEPTLEKVAVVIKRNIKANVRKN